MRKQAPLAHLPPAEVQRHVVQRHAVQRHAVQRHVVQRQARTTRVAHRVLYCIPSSRRSWFEEHAQTVYRRAAYAHILYIFIPRSDTDSRLSRTTSRLMIVSVYVRGPNTKERLIPV